MCNIPQKTFSIDPRSFDLYDRIIPKIPNMLVTNFTPFPTLVTPRLVLRRIELWDAEDIFNHRLNERVNTYLENFRHTSLEQTQAFILRIQEEIKAHKTILWVLAPKDTNRFIGTVCFWNISIPENRAETGYTLDPAFHQQGYMHEALEKIMEYGLNTMLLQTIDAYTRFNNEPSIKLLVKNGFQQDHAFDPEQNNQRLHFIFTHPTQQP
jgi:ribosomal-protein-alanine N-acetyltransferase